MGELPFSQPEDSQKRHHDSTEACLNLLLRGEYRSTKRIEGLLRHNVCLQRAVDGSSEQGKEPDDAYGKAAKAWSFHLTKLDDPSRRLLQLANEFLNCVAFVHWSEYFSKANHDFGTQFEVYVQLRRWRGRLPDDLRSEIDLEHYYEGQYRKLSEAYKQEGNDKILQWLYLYQLVDYYAYTSTPQEDHSIRKDLFEGVKKVLGDEDPLTLRVKLKLALFYIKLGSMEDAGDTLRGVDLIQGNFLSNIEPDPYLNRQLRALISFFTTHFEESEKSQKKTIAGLEKEAQKTTTEIICSRLYWGYAMNVLGNHEEAWLDFECMYRLQSEARGSDNGLALTALVARGQSERQLGLLEESRKDLKESRKSLEESRESLEEAWEARRRLWGIKHWITVDVAVRLIATYRELGRTDKESSKKAWQVVGQLEKEGAIVQHFSSFCQITHLCSLLAYDDGKVDEAVKLLQTLLDGTAREKTIRWLLWIRLSAAAMLREQHKVVAASMLFYGLVRAKNPSAEPDRPRRLIVAEEGLKLCRTGKVGEAQSLLDCEGSK